MNITFRHTTPPPSAMLSSETATPCTLSEVDLDSLKVLFLLSGSRMNHRIDDGGGFGWWIMAIGLKTGLM